MPEEGTRQKPYEKVDHPAHYGGKDNPYEAIKVIEAWALGFNLGTVLRYIGRAGRKPMESPLDDLKKARWYLDREISQLEAQQAKKLFDQPNAKRLEAERAVIDPIGYTGEYNPGRPQDRPIRGA